MKMSRFLIIPKTEICYYHHHHSLGHSQPTDDKALRAGYWGHDESSLMIRFKRQGVLNVLLRTSDTQQGLVIAVENVALFIYNEKKFIFPV